MRRELVHRQGGKCARCGKPMGDDVHIARIRTIRPDEGPAPVSAGNMVATYPDCTMELDLVHTLTSLAPQVEEAYDTGRMLEMLGIGSPPDAIRQGGFAVGARGSIVNLCSSNDVVPESRPSDLNLAVSETPPNNG